MKAESSEAIKNELKILPPKKLVELLLRMARFKKENKELLSYLLFAADNLHGYVESIKLEINEDFADLPRPIVFHTKKSIRKILRTISRQNRYMASKWAHAELLLHFCKSCVNRNLVPARNHILHKIWEQQLEKLNAIVPELEDDLQFDFRKEIEKLKT